MIREQCVFERERKAGVGLEVENFLNELIDADAHAVLIMIRGDKIFAVALRIEAQKKIERLLRIGPQREFAAEGFVESIRELRLHLAFDGNRNRRFKLNLIDFKLSRAVEREIFALRVKSEAEIFHRELRERLRHCDRAKGLRQILYECANC